MLKFVKLCAGKVRATNLAIANISSVGALQIPIISHIHFGFIPFPSPAIISKSSSKNNSVEAIIFYKDKNPTTTGRSIPSESCKISPEDFANIFLKP